jgi:hypothetical protein
VVSSLLRRSLAGAPPGSDSPGKARSTRTVAGFRPFPPKSGVITTNDQVNALRDAEGV